MAVIASSFPVSICRAWQFGLRLVATVLNFLLQFQYSTSGSSLVVLFAQIHEEQRMYQSRTRSIETKSSFIPKFSLVEIMNTRSLFSSSLLCKMAALDLILFLFLGE